jgi:hypothetical protein
MHIQNRIQTKTNETGYVPDFGIHKGIVIDNNDRLGGRRVQVYIPDVHGIALFGFLNQDEAKYITQGTGQLNTKAIEYLKTFCPWAEMCMPILSDSGQGTVDGNGAFTLVTSNEAEKYQGLVSQFGVPGNYLLPRGNAFAYVTVPSYSQYPAGTFSTPKIGMQVMVMFYKGDINSPVCIGGANGLLSDKVVNVLNGSNQDKSNAVSPPPAGSTTPPNLKQTKSVSGASSPAAAAAPPTILSPVPPPPTVNNDGAPNLLLPPLNRKQTEIVPEPRRQTFETATPNS